MKLATLIRHFKGLCKKHKVKVALFEDVRDATDAKGLGGLSNRADRIIWIPELKSRVSVLIAMHELGHVLGPWQHATTLRREAGAWKWARQHSLVWGPSETKTMHIGAMGHYTHAMMTHLLGHKKPIKFPPREHYFWTCLPPLQERPDWLSKDLHVVPWAEVLRSPQRPRCATCRNWQPHHHDVALTEWGNCRSPEEPMGVNPLVPEDALCGRGYLPNI